MPTTEGWKRRNEIEGLKFFLGVAEADRLRVLNPPDFTPALYERLLPYAVAPRRRDGMEPALRRGVGRFTDPIPAELVRREPSLEPSDTADFSSDLGGGLATAINAASTPIAAASTAPSSNGGWSGGGDGGSGDGGGGGGSGW